MLVFLFVKTMVFHIANIVLWALKKSSLGGETTKLGGETTALGGEMRPIGASI